MKTKAYILLAVIALTLAAPSAGWSQDQGSSGQPQSGAASGGATPPAATDASGQATGGAQGSAQPSQPSQPSGGQ